MSAQSRPELVYYPQFREAFLHCPMAYECSADWFKLLPTERHDVRHCTTCQRDVHFCTDQQQLDAQLAQPTTTPITEFPGAGQGGAEKKGRASDAYRKAFWDSIRHKNFIDVQNALSVGTDADGGYLVPDEFEHQLIDKLQEENFFRSLATVIHTSGDRKIPIVTGHGEASWMEIGRAHV